MKAFFLLCSATVLCATLALVSSSKCNHNDPSGCGITCNNAGEVPGCEHETCTCVPDGGNTAPPCSVVADCANKLTCDHHGETVHCLDSTCKCMKH